jgi:hypothetical protein
VIVSHHPASTEVTEGLKYIRKYIQDLIEENKEKNCVALAFARTKVKEAIRGTTNLCPTSCLCEATSKGYR